jgi:hypothetical protein
MQGTYREDARNMQGTFRAYAGNMQGTIGNIQGTCRRHAENNDRIHWVHPAEDLEDGDLVSVAEKMAPKMSVS